MIACENDSLSLHHKIDNFLLTYRSTPHATTGESPARLLFGQDLKTRLSLIRPSVGSKVQDKQSSQKKPHDDKYIWQYRNGIYDSMGMAYMAVWEWHIWQYGNGIYGSMGMAYMAVWEWHIYIFVQWQYIAITCAICVRIQCNS